MSKFLSMTMGFLFISSYFWFTYIAFSSEYFDPFVVILGLFLLFYIFMDRLEYTGALLANPVFLGVGDGICGSVIEILDDKPGKVSIVVSCASRYIPKSKFTNIGIVKGFMSMMSLQSQMIISDDEDKFIIPPANKNGAIEGTYTYLGSVWGFETVNINVELLNRIKTLNHKVSIFSGIMEEYQTLSTVLSETKNQEILNASQKIAALLKDINDAQVPRLQQMQRNHNKENNNQNDYNSQG